MSLMKPILNAWLRYTEKPALERATDPALLRRSFERKARFYFHGPPGSDYACDRFGEVPVLWARARDVAQTRRPVILYFHGGAYIFGSPCTHRAMLAQISRRTDLPACLPAYRKAPEHPFPAAIEDAVAVYRELVAHSGGVVLGGDSAGGGLALALGLEIKRLGLPRPLGTFCLSPLTDFTFSHPSLRGNAQADVMLPAEAVTLALKMVMQGRPADDPLISPIRGDFRGGAPVWICVGDTEILLDDARLMADRLRAQGVETTLRIERDLPHVWPILHNLLPEAGVTLDQIADWISSLPRG